MHRKRATSRLVAPRSKVRIAHALPYPSPEIRIRVLVSDGRGEVGFLEDDLDIEYCKSPQSSAHRRHVPDPLFC